MSYCFLPSVSQFRLLAALLPGALAAQSPSAVSGVARPSVPSELAGDTTARTSTPITPAPTAPAPARPTTPTARPSAVTPFGEVRSRAELIRPGGDAESDGFTFLRSRVGLRMQAGPHVRAVLGMQANRTVDAEARVAGADALDLYEGYLELAHPVREAQVALRAGRQELAVSNERLLGRRNWANTKHSFDGVRLTAGPQSAGAKGAPPAWSATAFGVSPAVHPTHAVAATVPTHYLFGADVVSPLRGLPGATVEATVLHDRGVRSRTREVADRTTVVGRVRAGRVLGLSADVEAARQFGTQRALATSTAPQGPDETIDAWMVGTRVGTPVRAGRRVTAALGLDLLSGDAPSSSTRHGAFDTLYGSNHSFYGFADIAGGNPASTLKGRGLADALATSTVVVSKRVSLRTDVHRMTPMRGGGMLGWEADLVAPIRVMRGLTAELGQSAFRAGDAGAALGLGPARRLRGWSYLALTATY